jgi:beta-1,2-mannobiose phosphorylase / 1,2-beta-oligomannan phosphorylase
MPAFIRIKENPIISPKPGQAWEAMGSFNPSVVKQGQTFHLLYRAQSAPFEHHGQHLSVSSIGYASSKDGRTFSGKRQMLEPEHDWEKYGIEDPRITFCDGKYYIFYTALTAFPFSAAGIKIGLATTQDFKLFEKHPVTPFNSKAMALFPEKINGQFVAVLTANTDLPPAKIALAFFDKEEEIWSQEYWKSWYSELDSHVIPLMRSTNDHVEVGAQPVKTEQGWLLLYSYIQNYFSDQKIFGIESVLLDLNNPAKVIGKSTAPLLLPETDYELHGHVPNITFPSGAIEENGKLSLYYGAGDTDSCLALTETKKIINELLPSSRILFKESDWIKQGFKRYTGNPIISPRPEFAWEAKATFNPAVIYEAGKFHILYRAMSMDDTSVFGYATSIDGVHIDERLHYPVYEPRAGFEKKLRPGNSGCEDPRLTVIGDMLYVFYAAFDGYTPRVAFSSIALKDFIEQRWHWAEPQVVTPPNLPDKDACLLSKKIDGKFIVFHRAYDSICINMEDDLAFDADNWLVHRMSLIKPRKTYWDNSKFGIASPPIETPYGWLMFYHRVAFHDSVYKVEAALLDLQDPSNIIAQTDATLLEPEVDYEEKGIVSNVVFPCGAVLKNDCIYLYYGGADKVVGVAKMALKDLLLRFGICT